MTAPADSGLSERKRFANLQAAAALNGIALVESTNDGGRTVFFVSRWALTKELPDLDAVESWLRMVTGRQIEGRHA